VILTATAGVLSTYDAPAGAVASNAFAGFAASPSGGGFWRVTGGGTVTPGGSARWYGDARNVALRGSIVGIAPTALGHGYWLVASDGGLFSYGDAHFYGSMGGKTLKRPVIGMAATPTGHGYWMYASDGGIFSFGDAHFFGSTGALALKSPIVGMSSRPDGHGYWLVAADGGVFAFHAPFYGSTGAMRLNSPVVGMLATSTGRGYWLVAHDGGVFSFGDARFYGSPANLASPPPVVGLSARAQHKTGYIVVAADGRTYEYGPGAKTAHFATTGPGAALPSDAACAAQVRSAAENRPTNTPYNMTRGHQKHLTTPYALFSRVDGNYTGTTDEILQWTACKWGIDEDIVRAQAATESWWDQRSIGDFQSNPSNCVPGHGIGADGHAGQCPASGGLLSITYQYYAAAFPDAMQSTAYNADYMYAWWRSCYDGQVTWLNTVERGSNYAAGDAWGCVGAWFAGRWHTPAAEGYISGVKQYVSERIWAQPQFKYYGN
jgi:hypothetical protein